MRSGRTQLATVLASVAALVAAAGVALSAEPTESDLEAGFASFLEALARSEQALRESPSFASDAERAGAYQHLARSVKAAIESEVLQDPDFPYFRIIDFWARQGGDNPDQRYAFTPVRGGEAYRVWGRLGSARRIELQLYAGQPWAGTGRSAGYLAFEDIAIAPDGSFSIRVGGEASDDSWLANPPDATELFARQIYDEWNAADPGEIYIDRVGWEGARKPLADAAQVAEQLRAAAAELERSATTWPVFVQRRYVGAGPANTISGLIDTYALGGVKGRWMAGGSFDLPPGKVLLIETWPTTAAYQAIQLTDLWFASLEYANQVSSLTTTQSIEAPNGAYYSVIARDDPGYANWLDTGGLARGVFLLRYDGVSGDVPKAQHPSAKLVDASALPDLIPGFAHVTEAEREATRAARRRHVQIRNHR